MLFFMLLSLIGNMYLLSDNLDMKTRIQNNSSHNNEITIQNTLDSKREIKENLPIHLDKKER